MTVLCVSLENLTSRLLFWNVAALRRWERTGWEGLPGAGSSSAAIKQELLQLHTHHTPSLSSSLQLPPTAGQLDGGAISCFYAQRDRCLVCRTGHKTDKLRLSSVHGKHGLLSNCWCNLGSVWAAEDTFRKMNDIHDRDGTVQVVRVMDV